jgi:hypothetical protein
MNTKSIKRAAALQMEQDRKRRERFLAVREPGNAWVREVSTRPHPPTQAEWDLWRTLNAALAELP